jgi:hypothetical protein
MKEKSANRDFSFYLKKKEYFFALLFIVKPYAPTFGSGLLSVLL